MYFRLVGGKIIIVICYHYNDNIVLVDEAGTTVHYYTFLVLSRWPHVKYVLRTCLDNGAK